MRAEIWMGVVISIAFQTIRKRALRTLKNMTMGRLRTRLSLTSTRCEALRRISPTKKMKLSVKCWVPLSTVVHTFNHGRKDQLCI